MDIGLLKAKIKSKLLSKSFYKLALYSSPDVILALNADYMIIFANHSAADLKGDDPVGKYAFEYVPPEFESKVKASLRDVFDKNVSCSFEMVDKKSGGWYNINLFPLIDGDVCSVAVVVCTNISKHKELEARLNAQNDELKKMNELMVGRELKMVELKKRIKELEAQLGEKDSKKR
jgi:PAS domain S-box-containing protein